MKGSGQRWLYVGVDEILTYEEERLIEVHCQSVGEAVAKVEPRRMSTPSAIALMSASRNVDLGDRYWLNNNRKLIDQLAELTRRRRILRTIDYQANFEEVGC